MKAFLNYSVSMRRVVLSLMIISLGLIKATHYESAQVFMDYIGASSSYLPLAILIEIVGGLMVLFAVKIRITAIVLASFSFISACLYHSGFANQTEVVLFMGHLLITAAVFSFVVLGPNTNIFERKHIKE